jgi:hypothetical protein
MESLEIPKRQLLKTIHVGAPWAAEIRIEKIPHQAGRHSDIAQDHLFEVSATWTGPNLRGELVDPRGINVRDCATTRSYGRALEAAEKAAVRLRQGQVPNLPGLLPASRLSAQ